MFDHPASQFGYILWAISLVSLFIFPSIGFPYAVYGGLLSYICGFGGTLFVVLGVIAQVGHHIVAAIQRQQDAILAELRREREAA
jgi:hypothetical protein